MLEIKGKKVSAFVSSAGKVVFKVLGNDDKWRVFETTNISDTEGNPVFRNAHKEIVSAESALSSALADRTARRHAAALKTGKSLIELH